MNCPKQTYTFQFKFRGIDFERKYEIDSEGSLRSLWFVLTGFFSDELDNTNSDDKKLIKRLKKTLPDLAKDWKDMDDDYFTLGDFLQVECKVCELEYIEGNTYVIIYSKKYF